MARKAQNFTIPLRKIPSPRDKSKKPPAEKSERDSLQVFLIETDLPYLTGSEQVVVGEEGASYTFTILSPVGGSFGGYISFRDAEYPEVNVWHTVTVEVTSPAEERSVTVESVVRKAVAVEITLDNPTEDTLTFEVNIQGEGLLGQTTFDLPPRSVLMANNGGSDGDAVGTYELIFSPLRSGEYLGRISFYNARVGEVWYKLVLKALPATPIVVETIESMIGTSQQVKAPVENPLAEQVLFSVHVADAEHFSVPSDKITLSPYAQSFFLVSFR